MKPFRIQELVELIAQIKGGNANVSKRLAKYNPLLEQLWRLVVKAKGKCDAAFKKRTFVKLFDKNTAYDEAKIDELLIDLREFLDMFFRASQTNTAIGQKVIADTLRKHGYNKSANKAIRKTLRLAEQAPEITQHFVNLSIHNDRYLKDKGIIASREICLREKNNFDLVFDLEFLVDELSILRRQRKKTGQELLQRTEAIKARIPYQTTPLIAIQLKAVEYFEHPCLIQYKAFYNIYFEKVDLLKSRSNDLLFALLNALVVFPNTPKEIRQDYVLLYEFGIDRGLFLEQGKIEPLMFDNIVFTAQSLGDFQLVRKAIEAYEGKILGEDDKDRSLAMAKAYLHYGNGEYAKALEVLTTLDKDNYLNPHLVIKKYNLAFKCAYEQATDKQDAVTYMEMQKEPFLNILDTYEGVHLSSQDKQNCLNFFNLLCQIAKREGSKKEIEKILDSFDFSILELKWIKEKIAELLIWEYIDGFKDAYDNTWHKYNSLEFILSRGSGFKKILNRYKKKGFINEFFQKSCLNFYNILCRICDERNPKNAKRRIIIQMEKYGERMILKEWVQGKIEKLRP